MERIKLLRYVNVAALCNVALFNIIDFISEGRPLARYFGYVVPFLVIAAVLLIWKNYKINAVLYALFGFIISLTGNTGNFSGAIFLIFSIYIFNTPMTNYILLSLCGAVLTARYLFMGYTIPDTMNQLIAYSFTFGVYFILMHPKPEPKPIVAHVDDTTIEVVRYLQDGMRVKDIAERVCLEPSTVYQRLRRARNKYGCGSNQELYKAFDKSGYFRQKPDSLP